MYDKKISYASPLENPQVISGEDLGATRAAYRSVLLTMARLERMMARVDYDEKKLKRYLEKYGALETPAESEDEDNEDEESDE